MKRKFASNLSANTLQLIGNQLLGLIIFYILSINLDKNSFGQLNLALALMLAIFNILSFGIDQIAVRKLAAGENPQTLLSLYISHVLITGVIFYLLLFISGLLFPHTSSYPIILLIGAGKLMIYFSTPLKQTAIGLERFKLLAYLSIISNTIRASCLIVLAFLHQINLQIVVIIFITGDVLELLIGAILFKYYTSISLNIKWDKIGYKHLIKEALPQLGVVLITSTLARFDWIFIGIVLSAVKLAEYSFAYKVFELSTLPLLAIAPLLIPWFTRLFKNDDTSIDTSKLKLLLRIEMIIAGLTIVVINSCWSPIIDKLTMGKYGQANELVIFILSLCIPLLYLTNFLWTINFAKGKLKMILIGFLITLVINIIVDTILIPLYKNEGAALGYLLGYIAQTLYFMVKTDTKGLNKAWYVLPICIIIACIAIYSAKVLPLNLWAKLSCAIVCYIIGLIISLQIRWRDVKYLTAMIFK